MAVSPLDIAITIRIPKTLKADLDKLKDYENDTNYTRMSFNSLVVKALAEYCNNHLGAITPSK